MDVVLSPLWNHGKGFQGRLIHARGELTPPMLATTTHHGERGGKIGKKIL